MKKLFVITLIAAMLLGVTGCAVKKNTAKTEIPESIAEKEAEEITGGWTRPESSEITEEMKERMEKAMEGWTGASFTPIAYLGYQIVAGTNYAVLCRVTPVVLDPTDHFAVVYIYEDLEGNVTITEVVDLPDEEVSEEENNMQIANPFITYDSMDDAAADAGFSMTAPESIPSFNEKLYQVMSHEMLQVIYYNDEASLFVRKAKGSDDISGDYNIYSDVKTVTVNDHDTVIKGNDGDFYLAMWTADGYTYAVTSDLPMSAEVFSQLVAEIN